MLQALLAGVASIKAQQTRINVIGNNLANVNTVAFKGSRVTFKDMIAQTMRGASGPTGTRGGQNALQFGLGVLVAGTDVNNEQGSLNATNRPTDIAVQGNGYLIVGNGSRMLYTRDGAFDLDANGDLVHRSTGEKLLGWSADADGVIDTSAPVTAASSIRIPIGQLSAVQVTTKVEFAGNLNANALPADEWQTQFAVYDTLGGKHDLQMRLFNRVANPTGAGVPAGAISAWSWEVTEPPSATVIGTSDGATPTGEPLYFDANGRLLNTSAVQGVTVAASNAPAFTFNLNFSDVNQLASETQVQASSQNGYPPGSLQGLAIGADGEILGLFTNGITRSLGRIAMAVFSNPAGLQISGSNTWRMTDNSGIPVIGTAATGGRGTLNAGFLEQSNIDIGSEFTDLIVTQRGFQANTRVVTTVDEMMQDLLNMRR
ncbi:MAG: hypothetical protein AMXMBFR19_07980 [Chthonomonadaceae bacterium]|uniref:Flagellar hook protein FlgE n=1 Tax=Candidatus Nitrosymbiomonas proteolyticus TaxID=2608984 RepID=A0A809R9L4_9BACT|nr:Flagellar hook protein FlgE [Fimbriimonadaceae bacterium]BBO24139.1 flagellar hook-basal body protein [Candidatus Nitrosymbiomonas proteolyticus]